MTLGHCSEVHVLPTPSASASPLVGDPSLLGHLPRWLGHAMGTLWGWGMDGLSTALRLQVMSPQSDNGDDVLGGSTPREVVPMKWVCGGSAGRRGPVGQDCMGQWVGCRAWGDVGTGT